MLIRRGYLRVQREDGAGGSLESVSSDISSREGLAKLRVVFDNLDVASAGKTVEENGDLDGAVRRALEIVAVTSSDVSVKSGLAACVARVENLEDVPFTASGFPARALVVLSGTGDVGVKNPGGGHILVCARPAGHGHGELQEEELVFTTESVFTRA